MNQELKHGLKKNTRSPNGMHGQADLTGIARARLRRTMKFISEKGMPLA